MAALPLVFGYDHACFYNYNFLSGSSLVIVKSIMQQFL